MPRTTRNIESAMTRAEIDSKDRFCDSEKVMWLHQDLKFSVNEFMAESSDSFTRENAEKLGLWLKNDIYKLWSARNNFLGGGTI